MFGDLELGRGLGMSCSGFAIESQWDLPRHVGGAWGAAWSMCFDTRVGVKGLCWCGLHPYSLKERMVTLADLAEVSVCVLHHRRLGDFDRSEYSDERKRSMTWVLEWQYYRQFRHWIKSRRLSGFLLTLIRACAKQSILNMSLFSYSDGSTKNIGNFALLIVYVKRKLLLSNRVANFL